MSSVRVLSNAFSACTRFVFVIGINEHLNRVVGCPIMEYLKYRCIVLTFKLLINKAPEYLCDELQYSMWSNALILPRHYSSQCNRSFFVNAVSSNADYSQTVKYDGYLYSFKRRCFDIAAWCVAKMTNCYAIHTAASRSAIRIHKHFTTHPRVRIPYMLS